MLLRLMAAISGVCAAVICAVCGGFAGLRWLWLLPAAFVGSYAVLLVLAFLFLWFMSAIVDTSRPQECDSKFYRRMIELYVEAVITLLGMRVRTRGLENVPKDGRFLLVCNHLSLLDVVVLFSCFRRSQLTFVTKQENMDMFIIGKLMHKIMCQPLNRENDREALKAILKCIQFIKEDRYSIGIFPEGARSQDGKLQHFRSGAFKIAQKPGVPVLVCTLQNTNKVFRNFLRLKPTEVPLHLLGVIPAEEVGANSTVEIAGRAHSMMADDLGPELVAD